MNTVYIGSSHGEFSADATTGKVIKKEIYEGSETEPVNFIDKFDIEEYKKHYNTTTPPEYIDILDLGYWLENGAYEEPAHDWRKEFRKN